MARAKGEEPRVVILRFDGHEASKVETVELLERWESSGGPSIEILRAGGKIDPAAAIACCCRTTSGPRGRSRLAN